MFKMILVIMGLFLSQLTLAQQSFQVISHCQEADYMLADLVSSVSIQGMSYTPKCIQVKVGSRVTITASKRHPLAPQAQSGNPIKATERTQEYTFSEAGFFGYYCDKHGDASGEGMAGAVWVVE